MIINPDLKFAINDKVTSVTGRTGVVVNIHYSDSFKGGKQTSFKKYFVHWFDNDIKTWTHEDKLTRTDSIQLKDDLTADLVLIVNQIDMALDLKDEEVFYKLVKQMKQIESDLERLEL